MTAAARFRQADLTRALKAAEAAGRVVESFRIDPATGGIEITLATRAANDRAKSNPWDKVL